MLYVELFIFEILLGYVLQSAGAIICLYAFSGKKIAVKQFLLLTIINAAAVYIIRQIDIITFGIHTLLIMIGIIFLGWIVLKTSINAAAISALITMVTITVGEALNYMVLLLLYGDEKINLFKDDRLYKAVGFFPTNLFLLGIMLIIYQLYQKKSKGGQSGKAGEENR